MTGKGRIRIVVHSADPLARAGLVALLERFPALLVVDQIEAWDEVARARGADAIVSDFREGDRHASSELVGQKVLALVTNPIHARQAKMAGALGTIRRDAEEEELEAAIRAVALGLEVSSFALQTLQPDGDETWEPEPLTTRETETLELIAAGLSNKAIAVRMGIRESTVKFHVNAVLAKLGAQSRTDAVGRALRAGLIRF